MATRTQARESVIGLLYGYDLGNVEIAKFVDDILEEKKIRNSQKEFALNLFNGTIKNILKIDKGTKNERAISVGKEIAKIAIEKGIKTVVFDRNGFKYTGRVKLLADKAREGGLIF